MSDLLITLAIVILAGVGAFFAGRKTGKDAVARERAEDDAETVQRIADAQAGAPDNVVDLESRLRGSGL